MTGGGADLGPATPTSAGTTTPAELETRRVTGGGHGSSPKARQGPSGSAPTFGGPGSSTAVVSEAPAEYSCPGARTCPDFKVIEGDIGGRGWRPDADGVVRIRYWLNPNPPALAKYTREDVIKIFDRVTAVWAAASPGRLEFVRLGLIDGMPMNNNGVSEFSVGASVNVPHDKDRYITETDINPVVNDQDGYWAPCEQTDDSCTPVDPDDNVHIEELITHEVGHTVGLADLPSTPEYDGLTMQATASTGAGFNSRYHVTLGLGDVLGVRHLYPCGCPLPHIYLP